MKVDNETFRKVSALFEQKRVDSEYALRKRKDGVYEKIPEIRKLDMELMSISAQISRGIFQAGNLDNVIGALRESQSAALMKRADLLLANGFDADFLDVKYDCERCMDYGYIGTEMCSCFRQKLEEEYKSNTEKANAAAGETFENFNFDYYSNVKSIDGITYRNNIRNVYNKLYDYAYNFKEKSESILLTGETGLGKTYLARSIAGVLKAQNYSVVIDTAQNIFDMLEADKFGRDNGKNTDNIKTCDFLVIDDLGSEFVNSFTLSAIYNILNTRQNLSLKTLITTNLSFAQLEKIYQERIISRLIGEFSIYRFIGEDIRQKIHMEKLK